MLDGRGGVLDGERAVRREPEPPVGVAGEERLPRERERREGVLQAEPGAENSSWRSARAGIRPPVAQRTSRIRCERPFF